MRSRIEGWIRRWWTEGHGWSGALLSLVTFPLELLFREAVRLRNLAFDRGWIGQLRAPIPVISIGNLTVGGAGKTPLAAWIAGRLHAEGISTALISRGYGEDETRLHARWNPEVPVYTDPDRHRAVMAAAGGGAAVAVLDDAFQHRRLARDLDLLLLSAEAMGKVRLLPRGPYREPLASLRRADLIVVTRKSAPEAAFDTLAAKIQRIGPPAPIARVSLVPAGWFDLSGEAADPPSGPLLAVAGIARPDGFADLARSITGSEVELMSFSDHHDFTDSDLRRIQREARGRMIVTTEKDAVRLSADSEVAGEFRVLHLRVEVEEGEDLLRDAMKRAISAPGSPRIKSSEAPRAVSRPPGEALRRARSPRDSPGERRGPGGMDRGSNAVGPYTRTPSSDRKPTPP